MIKVKDFQVSSDAPTVSNFRLVHCCDRADEIMFDVDLTYNGLMAFVLNTTYTAVGKVCSSVQS